MGRTKGGLNTKIHSVVTARLQPIVIALSVGPKPTFPLRQSSRITFFNDSSLSGDTPRPMSSSNFRETATPKGVKTCIPGRTNRTTAVPFPGKLNRRRHLTSKTSSHKIKRYRRVATRCDKLRETFLGFVCLAILHTLQPYMDDLQTCPRACL